MKTHFEIHITTHPKIQENYSKLFMRKAKQQRLKLLKCENCGKIIKCSSSIKKACCDLHE